MQIYWKIEPDEQYLIFQNIHQLIENLTFKIFILLFFHYIFTERNFVSFEVVQNVILSWLCIIHSVKRLLHEITTFFLWFRWESEKRSEVVCQIHHGYIVEIFHHIIEFFYVYWYHLRHAQLLMQNKWVLKFLVWDVQNISWYTKSHAKTTILQIRVSSTQNV